MRRCQFFKLEELGKLPTFGAMPIGYCPTRAEKTVWAWQLEKKERHRADKIAGWQCGEGRNSLV